MEYIYSAYNLTFQSQIPLPELTSLNELSGNGSQDGMKADVSIRLGSVPKELAAPGSEGVVYQASENQFLLRMDSVARYLVQNGNEIIIEPAPDASESDIRVFMLGSCFGALLHQRELLVIHASAIHTEMGAILFCGPSGIGKSTLLGELLNRGYSMLVDDVCAVEVDESGIPVVLPGYPRTRLWADAAKKLKVETAGLERTRPTLEKYERQLPEQFWPQPTPLGHIYSLGANNKEDLTLHPLPRIRTFGAVLNNTYRQIFLDGLEMRQPHFKQASAVASHVGVTRVIRPSGGFKLKELADLVEEDWMKPSQNEKEKE